MNKYNLITAAILSAGIIVWQSPAKSQEAINVVSYGGQITLSLTKGAYEPFSQDTNIKINSVDYSGGLAEVKAQVLAGNVTWDAVDVEYADAIRGCEEGLFERLDPAILPTAPDGTPAEEDFIPGTMNECALPLVVWSTVFTYDDSKIGADKPTAAADFFDTQRWPGKRGLRKTPKGTLEFALLADGVSADEVYSLLATPEGVDRAFAKLDSIKKDIIWWQAGAQPPQLLADGEVLMAHAYNGRIFSAAVDEGKPFVIVWDGQLWDMNHFVVVKGSKKTRDAMRFIAYATSTESLAEQTKWIPYGPARRSAMAAVSTNAKGDVQMAPHLPTAPENMANALQLDPIFWADQQDQLNERFNVWLMQQ